MVIRIKKGGTVPGSHSSVGKKKKKGEFHVDTHDNGEKKKEEKGCIWKHI